MANPYVSLMSTAWRYARHEKKKYVLVYSLFILASVVSAMNLCCMAGLLMLCKKKASTVLPMHGGLRVVLYC